MKIRVIGTAGHPGAGKDTIADFLVNSCGFHRHISGGDILRVEMAEHGLLVDGREGISEFAAMMREKHGNDYLTRAIIEQIGDETAAVSGFRNTEEVRVFREEFGNSFKLIAVEVSREARFLRSKKRGRIGDNVSFERFCAIEDKESASVSGAHEVDAVIQMADVVIQNDGTLEDLYGEVSEFLGLV